MANSFTPENPLENALVRAVTDPAARPEFYRLLLVSPLFFLTPPNTSPPAPEPGQRTSVELAFWAGPRGNFLPFFSSRERLDQAMSGEPEAYGFVSIDGREAFEEIRRSEIRAVLNPGLAHAKQFTLEEVRAILDGTIYEGQSISIERTTEVEVTAPVNVPQALTEVLSRLFSQHPDIERAYLGQVREGTSDVPIIGVVGDGFDDLVEKAGMTASEIIRGPVDLVRIGPDEEQGLGGALRKNGILFFSRPTAGEPTPKG